MDCLKEDKIKILQMNILKTGEKQEHQNAQDQEYQDNLALLCATGGEK